MTSQSAVLPVVAPRYLTAPRARSSAGPEVVELAASAGLFLDPWQADALEVGLRERPDGRWAALEVGLICPRQNGKGSILEALELAGLFLFGERLIVHSAHEFRTAKDAFNRVWGLIEDTDELRALVKRKLENNNELSIELQTGQKLRFMSRTGGAGRGFTADRVILDEAFNLPDRMLAALIPTLSALRNPQMWLTSSAPLMTEASAPLRRFCRRGRKGDDRLAYIEYCAERGVDIDDPEALEAANPGRINAEIVAVERGEMSDEDFARERLGIWSDDEAEERIIPEAAWNAVKDPKAPADPLTFAVDVNDDRTWASIVAVGANRAVEVIAHRGGLGWLLEDCKRLNEKWHPRWGYDPSGPVGSFRADFAKAGMNLVEVSGEAFVKACGSFYDGVADRTFTVRPHPGLDSAVAGARRRMVGDAWRWTRRDAAVDITPLVAATIGLQVAKTRAESSVVVLADFLDEDWDEED